MKEIDTKNQEMAVNRDPIIEFSINAHDFDISELGYTSEDDLDEKEIKRLENATIRKSDEYTRYMAYLKNELDLNMCELVPGLNPEENDVSIEIHHYPLSLFEITQIVSRKMLKDVEAGNKEYITEFEIAAQVMKEHYENRIGLVPLTNTLHEMAHSESMPIPSKCINGNYGEFLKKYADVISLEELNNITTKVTAGDSKEADEMRNQMLKKKIVNYKVTYNDEEEDADDIAAYSNIF